MAEALSPAPPGRCTTPDPQRKVLRVKTPAAVVVVATLLAGCTSDPDLGNPFDSLAEAQAAAGVTMEAGPWLVKLLEPRDMHHVTVGDHKVVLLVTQNGTGHPVTGLEIAMDATMPAMDHGTDAETDPRHDDFGIYVGRTDLFMPGDWQIAFYLRGDGDDAYAAVNVTAQAEDDDHEHGDHDHDEHGHGDHDHGDLPSADLASNVRRPYHTL